MEAPARDLTPRFVAAATLRKRVIAIECGQLHTRGELPILKRVRSSNVNARCRV